MKSIWKFPVPVTDQFVTPMPMGAEFLCVQTQRDEPQMWWLVSPDNKRESRMFRVYGTGHDVHANDGPEEYCGTFQMHGGALVFHLFEVHK